MNLEVDDLSVQLPHYYRDRGVVGYCKILINNVISILYSERKRGVRRIKLRGFGKQPYISYSHNYYSVMHNFMNSHLTGRQNGLISLLPFHFYIILINCWSSSHESPLPLHFHFHATAHSFHFLSKGFQNGIITSVICNHLIVEGKKKR